MASDKPHHTLVPGHHVLDPTQSVDEANKVGALLEALTDPDAGPNWAQVQRHVWDWSGSCGIRRWLTCAVTVDN